MPMEGFPVPSMSHKWGCETMHTTKQMFRVDAGIICCAPGTQCRRFVLHGSAWAHTCAAWRCQTSISVVNKVTLCQFSDDSGLLFAFSKPEHQLNSILKCFCSRFGPFPKSSAVLTAHGWSEVGGERVVGHNPEKRCGLESPPPVSTILIVTACLHHFYRIKPPCCTPDQNATVAKVWWNLGVPRICLWTSSKHESAYIEIRIAYCGKTRRQKVEQSFVKQFEEMSAKDCQQFEFQKIVAHLRVCVPNWCPSYGRELNFCWWPWKIEIDIFLDLVVGHWWAFGFICLRKMTSIADPAIHSARWRNGGRIAVSQLRALN